jgi:hypothetical protein
MRDSSLQELSLKIAVHARNLFNTDPWLESYDVPEVKPFVIKYSTTTKPVVQKLL